MRSLRTRFFVSGALVVLVMAVMGNVCSYMFMRVSRGVGEELAKDEQKGELIGILGSALEDEDDALILAMAGDRGPQLARRHAEQRRFDKAFAALSSSAMTNEERLTLDSLSRHMDLFRRHGDALLGRADLASARATYDGEVTQSMRVAVIDLEHLRADELREIRHTAGWARDEAHRAKRLVMLVSIAALLLSLAVSVQLARSILRPIRSLTENVEAVRGGAFDRRVVVERDDEIGALAAGYNRMADALGKFSASKLGEVIRAKSTLEATLAALPDAVVLVHDDGRVEAANGRATAIFSAACGKAPADLAALAATPDGAKIAQAIKLAGQGVQLDRAVKLREGRDERRLIALVDGPTTANLRVIVLSDVTDLSRLDEMRMDFVAAASHELRTPLTTLRMMLSLLSESATTRSPHEEEMLRTALAGCDQLGQTVDAMLELAHAETGNIRLRRERFTVAALAKETLASLSTRARDAEVTMPIRDESNGATVEGDIARLFVVLSNVVSNALKYSPPETTIDVCLRDAGDSVEVLVTDEGPGVPAEYRERIFEKYFRVEHQKEGNEPSHGPRGAGMGLYLCRQIVEAHGGEISCAAGDTGKGTRITLKLPKKRESTRELESRDSRDTSEPQRISAFA